MSVIINGRKLKEVDETLNDFEWTEEELAEMELNVELACKIIEARESQGISQQKLAELSGLKQSAISRLEKFETQPQISTLNKALIPLGYKIGIVPLSDTPPHSR